MEAKRAYERAYYAEKNRDKKLVQVRAYRDANPERARSWSAAQRSRDPQKANEATRRVNERYRRETPERVKEWQDRYFATEKGRLARSHKAQKRRGVVTDEFTKDYIAILLNDPCVYCGGSGGTIDHIVPIKADGTSEWDNLTSACRSCNGSKSCTDLLTFLTRSNA